MDRLLSCSKAAQLIGVSDSTLKRMCDDGLLPSIRTPGGHRRLRFSVVEAWLKQNGRGTPSESMSSLDVLNVEIEAVFQQLMNGEHLRLLSPIAKARHDGIALSTIFDSILAPAMRMVGDRWQDKTIDVYEEHLCSKHMRALLQSILESVQMEIASKEEGRSNQPTALGCAANVEQHDLASTMIESALLDHGWNAKSLGGTVPIDSLIQATRDLQPDLVWVCYTCIEDTDRIIDDNRRIHAELGERQYLAIGGQAMTSELRMKMAFDFFGDTTAHLLRYADLIQPPVSKTIMPASASA